MSDPYKGDKDQLRKKLKSRGEVKEGERLTEAELLARVSRVFSVALVNPDGTPKPPSAMLREVREAEYADRKRPAGGATEERPTKIGRIEQPAYSFAAAPPAAALSPLQRARGLGLEAGQIAGLTEDVELPGMATVSYTHLTLPTIYSV